MAWLVIAACLCGFLVCGQSSKKRSRRSASADRKTPVLYVPAESINNDIFLQRAPVYLIGDKKTRIGAGNSDASKFWLVNEISFVLSLRAKNPRPMVLDGVKVELYLYVPGQARDRRNYRWFYGCQKLHRLVFEPEQPNRRFWASLILPYQYVYLHVPLDRGRYNIKPLEWVVLISDRNNKLLGRYAFGNKFKLTSERTKLLLNMADEIQRKNGADCIELWPREKTPWAWLDAERFELPLTSLSENNPTETASPQPKADEQENKE